MTRRDLLKRLGLGAAAITLSPLLDLADIVAPPAAALVVDADYFMAVGQIKYMVNMVVYNPRRLMLLTGICE